MTGADGAPFIIIGENIHATRSLLLSGRHVARDPDGRESISFVDAAGTPRRLDIPDWYRESQDYAQGRLKHVAIAIRTGIDGGLARADALAYLQLMVDRQVRGGAAYLDLNVDELSPRLDDQKEAMRWLVAAVQSMTDVPVSVDSSHAEIIEDGLSASLAGSRPMLNSASLERLGTLDLTRERGCPVVVTAAGRSGIPHDASSRVANATEMVEAATGRGIPLADVFVDPLIFPVSVDGESGRHTLDAIAELRRHFGPEIHITGGMSNVSFGLPARRLLNDVFLRLAVEAGADSGIIDPTTTEPGRVRNMDPDERAYQLARDALLGADPHCRGFLGAHRAGEFALLGIAPPARHTA